MKRAKSVDEYFALIPREARPALKKLRKTIRTIIPNATEAIWYGIPTFRLDRMLVSYAAFREHCSFFPLSSRLLERFKREVARYETSKGTIRFSFDKPLPASLVRKIVAARIEEIKHRSGKGNTPALRASSRKGHRLRSTRRSKELDK